jgi:beta-glucosidase
LGRTPLGGRNWEGFSVDPYLTGKLSAESIIGHQDAGVIANVKVSSFLSTKDFN